MALRDPQLEVGVRDEAGPHVLRFVLLPGVENKLDGDRQRVMPKRGLETVGRASTFRLTQPESPLTLADPFPIKY